MDEESNYAAAERSLKQALHQLTHLQKVWQDVLPAAVYRKAIGTYIYCRLVLLEPEGCHGSDFPCHV